MKKIKHITINLNIDEYNALLLIADKQKRNITNMSYILLVDTIKKTVLQYVNIKSDDFTKLNFINE